MDLGPPQISTRRSRRSDESWREKATCRIRSSGAVASHSEMSSDAILLDVCRQPMEVLEPLRTRHIARELQAGSDIEGCLAESSCFCVLRHSTCPSSYIVTNGGPMSDWKHKTYELGVLSARSSNFPLTVATPAYHSRGRPSQTQYFNMRLIEEDLTACNSREDINATEPAPFAKCRRCSTKFDPVYNRTM